MSQDGQGNCRTLIGKPHHIRELLRATPHEGIVKQPREIVRWLRKSDILRQRTEKRLPRHIDIVGRVVYRGDLVPRDASRRDDTHQDRLHTGIDSDPLIVPPLVDDVCEGDHKFAPPDLPAFCKRDLQGCSVLILGVVLSHDGMGVVIRPSATRPITDGIAVITLVTDLVVDLGKGILQGRHFPLIHPATDQTDREGREIDRHTHRRRLGMETERCRRVFRLPVSGDHRILLPSIRTLAIDKIRIRLAGIRVEHLATVVPD